MSKCIQFLAFGIFILFISCAKDTGAVIPHSTRTLYDTCRDDKRLPLHSYKDSLQQQIKMLEDSLKMLKDSIHYEMVGVYFNDK